MHFVKVLVDSLTEIPDLLKDKADTAAEWQQKMMDDLENRLGAKDEESAEKLYDVRLEIYDDSTDEMEPLSGEKFPKEGVDVTVPYPAGTDKSYQFTASHIFAGDCNGFKAGQTEYPTIEKTDEGLKIHLNDTSPVLFRWTEEAASSTNDPVRRKRVIACLFG